MNYLKISEQQLRTILQNNGCTQDDIALICERIHDTESKRRTPISNFNLKPNTSSILMRFVLGGPEGMTEEKLFERISSRGTSKVFNVCIGKVAQKDIIKNFPWIKKFE